MAFFSRAGLYKSVLLFWFLIVFNYTSRAQNTLIVFTSEADTFLKKYVQNGRVAYADINQNKLSIKTLTDKIGNINLQGSSSNSKKAFYINAYNLLVIQAVTDLYPLKSVMNKPGFFDVATHLVAGEKLTLNDLEKKKLLQPYQDARLHFVLACAAVSCPPLASFAYTPNNLDNQLTTRTHLALNNNTFIRVSKKEPQLQISKIFDWYKTDFTGNNQTIVTFINTYRTDKIPANYQVSYYEYDWTLNKR